MLLVMENKSHGTNDGPRKLPLKLLEEITNNYAKEQRLGSGAFGDVYKGVLDGQVIAVKKLRFMPGISDKQFENEFEHLSNLKHQNIVQLVGFCDETKYVLVPHEGQIVSAVEIHRALCLEFVPGCLGKFLSEKCLVHDWHVRFKIIKGICEGLNYLDGFSVMHLDLKPENILLDEEMVPKIADFGLSRLMGEVNTIITMSCLGTRGYMPPEFINNQIISTKYDIFSLGVILKKIVSGEMDYFSIAGMGNRECIGHVYNYWEKKLRETPGYASLEVDCKQVRSCIEIAVACMEPDRQQRPTIEELVRKLNKLEANENDSRSQIEQVPFHLLSEFLPMIGEAHDMLVLKMGSILGAKVENNKISLSIHYRSVDEKQWSWMAEGVRSVLKEYPMLRLTQGRKVLEIRPAIGFGKGKALEFLLDSLSFADRSHVFPIYIDDDRADEDAFKLGMQPRQVCFPFEPKGLTSCALYLPNFSNDRIAFRLLTKIQRRYLTKLPLCEIVPPWCSCALIVIMREQKKQPPEEFLTLQSIIVPHQQNADPDSLAALFFKEDKETVRDEVKEVKLAVVCDPPEKTSSNQSVQSAAEIIACQNYREVLSVDVHPTEPWILTSNCRGIVSIWDYQTRATVNSVEVNTEEPVYSAKFVARERWLVAGDDDGDIRVYSYDGMEEVKNFEAHAGHIMSLAVNPTHSFLLSASHDHLIKLWDWKNDWKCMRAFKGHCDRVTQVMFDPKDSNSFASASFDRTVKIWNIYSDTPNTTLDGHLDGLLCLDYFTGDKRQFLISGSSDGAAKIWDLETKTCVGTLDGHANRLIAFCWHSEFPVLITGSLDGTIQTWGSTSNTYRLQNITGIKLGAVNAFGYIKELGRLVVGCNQGIAMMGINFLSTPSCSEMTAMEKFMQKDMTAYYMKPNEKRN